MEQDDLDEILKETELDSAKMVLRLSSELREKELELAALRSKSFEEIQRNNKAKEAEFEALIQGQEAGIRKRESELARLMVETESRLWQKHQAMLEEAISRHRSEIEEERARLNEEVARKEREVLEQKKNLRLEMEELFKKWETEREADFANERRTFVEELKLGRESAQREAEERSRHLEALWKEKFSQHTAETDARHAIALEEAVNKARQERLAEMKEMSDRLNAEIKRLYAEKESAMDRSRRETEEALLASERALEERRNRLETEFSAKYEKLRNELDRKEKQLEAEFSENSAELARRLSIREKALEEKEARITAEREELSGFRDQAAETIRRREAEITRVFEDRFALLKASMEESAAARELEFSRRTEAAALRFGALEAQKDEAQRRAAELSAENDELKRRLGERDAELRRMEEQEHERTARLRKTFEDEFSLKTQDLIARLDAEGEEARKGLEDRLRTESDRLAAQYRIKEEGLAALRESLGAQVSEMEKKFMETLRVKERESAENAARTVAALNDRLAEARDAAARDQAALRLKAEEALSAQSAVFEAGLREKDEQNERRLREAEKRISDEAARRLEMETGKIEESFQRRVSELESRANIMEQNLASARAAREAAQAQIRKLREEIELLTVGLDRSEQEKQALIQTNLSQAKDIRLALEKEFLEKLSGVENNYLAQLAEAIKLGEAREKDLLHESFKKLSFLKDDCSARSAAQLKEMESAYLERETRLREALEDGYRLKEKSLLTRYEQMERNYEAALSEKTIQLDNDRSMAESVARLKTELEERNKELNSRIAEHDRVLEDTRRSQEAAYAAARKEMEDEHRVKSEQLEKERAKIKALLEQEQRLVSDLQKREAALQESYAAKEAAMAREFELSRKRLESEYQARLKEPGRDLPPRP